MNTQFDFHIKSGQQVYKFDVEVLYRGDKVIRFLLKIKGHELLLQKKLLLKNGSWGILSSSFEFKKDDAAYTLLKIYRILDEKIGVIKPTYDPQKRNKD